MIKILFRRKANLRLYVGIDTFIHTYTIYTYYIEHIGRPLDITKRASGIFVHIPSTIYAT